MYVPDDDKWWEVEVSKKPIALIDLDGTLADFDGAIMRDLKALQTPYELELWNRRDENKHPYLKARRDLIKGQPNWWFNLEKLDNGFRILDHLRTAGYRLHVLTRGPKNLATAWEQKVRWARLHVPDASITITLDKSLSYGRILVDDWPDYITPWLKHRPRGLVIMPDQSWNRDFEHPQVVRYNGVADDIMVIGKILANKESIK